MTTETETERLPIDAWAVCLDETGHYNIDPADAPYIAAIHGVYVFDRNQQTHCCELTPSYYLIHLYDSVLFTGDVSDEKREELDEKYCYCESDDIYVHCHEIDLMIARNKRGEVSHYGDVAGHDREDDGTPEENREKEMEAIREDLCANCPF